MDIFPIPALQDNYIWALPNSHSRKVVIVDPGDAAPVQEMLSQHDMSLAGILVTHHHWDHTNGIEELLALYGEMPVVASELSTNQWVNTRVKNGDEVVVAHVRCRALAIPGHTLDHTAYFNEHENFLFTGDTLFSAGCGRVFEGTPEMMLTSLQKLVCLPDITNVYCGHEYTRNNLRFAALVEPDNRAIQNKLATLPDCTLPSTLNEEQLINPFLRCKVEAVIKSAENHARRELATPVEVFAELRSWKNNFT